MKFIAGFIFAFIVIGIVAFVYVHLGFADIRADQKPTQLETWFAGGGMDNSADRHAPKVQNPMQPTEANLHDGMVVYTMNCAVCHGTPAGDSEIGQREYPPAPQFMKDPADMAENQNFYIIKHGIRLSAMPGWDKTLSDDKIWKVVTFLANMDKLPANVDKDWKGNTSAPEVPAPAQQTPPQSERKHSHGHP